jgi:serine/threonine protein kinase
MSQTPSQAPTKDPSGPPPGELPGHSLPRGMRIGRDNAIELQSPVARGGMGEIWAAWLHDPRTPRRIAVKMPAAATPAAAELLAREAEMLDRVRDLDRVPTLLEHGTFRHGGVEHHFIAMDWIEGARPLDQAARGMPLDQIIALFAKACTTVETLHQRAIVHADLKPGNILVDAQGEPWVTDLGLAFSTRPGERRHAGQEIGSLRGTWACMAPEQRREGCDPHDFTAAVDVYALGVTLFRLVFGRWPHADRPDGDFASPPAIPRTIDGRMLPRRLRRCLGRALDPAGPARHSHAGELAHELAPLATDARAGDLKSTAVATLVASALALVVGATILSGEVAYAGWYRLVAPLAPTPTIRDVVVVGLRSTVDDSGTDTVDAPDREIIASKTGLSPSRSDRAFIAAVVDRLRELDARVVMLDYFFPSPGDPDDTRALVEAVEHFRGPDDAPRGWICFGMTDWRNVRGVPLVEPGLARIASHALSIKTTLAPDLGNLGIEAGFLGRDGAAMAAAPVMAAAALSDPAAAVRPDMFLRPWSNRADLMLRHDRRGAPGATRPPLTLRVSADRVADLADTPERRVELEALRDDDVILRLELPGIPSTPHLDLARLDAGSLWTLDRAQLTRQLANRVVVVGDLVTPHATHDGSSNAELDLWRIDGRDRPLWGVELQAAAVQGARDAMIARSGFIVQGDNPAALAAMPPAALAGVALSRRLLRRRVPRAPVVAGRWCVVALGVSCIAAATSYGAALWLWNPFVLPLAFAAGAAAALLTPWMRP